MQHNKHSIAATPPAGMRDHTPRMMQERQYIVDVLKHHFERYSFLPLATPAMERRETLLGKYGQDAAPLIFNVLNSGDFLAKCSSTEGQTSASLLSHITNKSLRYDLTLPLARYVATHAHQLTFPFRRYQIQPVWRADRPQKGRFREFLQCDIDIVGTTSLIAEAELIALIHDAFRTLGLQDFCVHLNHRQLLQGIAEHIGLNNQLTMLCTALDKWDKIGAEGVWATLTRKGVDAKAIQTLQELFSEGSNKVLLDTLANRLQKNTAGRQGIAAIRTILQHLRDLGVDKPQVAFTPTLARGLSYYTGPIFEVTTSDKTLGSIGGGGRYANLTGVFGLDNTPGTGFSFGLDRIQALLEKRQLFPGLTTTPQVLITQFDAASLSANLDTLAQLRANDITAVIYPAIAKLSKQLKYAQKCKIPYVVLIGEAERKASNVLLRNMEQHTQQGYKLPELISFLAHKKRGNVPAS